MLIVPHCEHLSISAPLNQCGNSLSSKTCSRFAVISSLPQFQILKGRALFVLPFQAALFCEPLSGNVEPVSEINSEAGHAVMQLLPVRTPSLSKGRIPMGSYHHLVVILVPDEKLGHLKHQHFLAERRKQSSFLSGTGCATQDR